MADLGPAVELRTLPPRRFVIYSNLIQPGYFTLQALDGICLCF